jgi:preprotein translocase subunit YajC
MPKSFGFLIFPPLALALAAAPASAQPAAPAPAANAQAAFAVGTTVRDTAGAEVGTVTKVDAQHVTVKTDKHEVPLPRTSFTATDKGLLFGMTRDQLNAAVDQAMAQAAAKMVVGATVLGSAGGTVGTIESLDDQFVTVKLTSGAAVRLPRSAVGAGPNGPVIGMTVDQLEAAAKAAAPAPAAAAGPSGK